MKKSRWFKIGLGCAGLVGLSILLVLIIGLLVAMDKPKPANRGHETAMFPLFPSTEDGGSSSNSGTFPNEIHLYINARFTHLNIRPGSSNSHIQVAANYDKANYLLNTESQFINGRMNFRLNFSSHQGTVAKVFHFNQTNAMMMDRNRIEVDLPRDIPIHLHYQIHWAETRIQLGGLSIAAIDGKQGIGDILVAMDQPNPVAMETMQVSYRMGQSVWLDLQNFRFKYGELRGFTGVLSLLSSGPFEQDAELFVHAPMSDVTVLEPPLTHFMPATTENPGQKTMSPLNASQDPLPKLTLSGSAGMGDFRWIENDQPNWFKKQALVAGNHGKVTGAIQILRNLAKTHPGTFENGELIRNGSWFLGRNKFEAAAAFLELQIELYPENALGFVYLGIAHFRLQNMDTALVHLRKALALDPTIKLAQEMIQRIEKESGGSPKISTEETPGSHQ